MPDLSGLTDSTWHARFPALFAPTYVDYADTDVTLTTAPAPEHLINRLHLVGVTGPGQVVVCGSDLGWRFLPGGRRKAEEGIEDLTDRELLEEAGAEATGAVRIFAAHEARSRRAEPHQPHMAHPLGYWAYAVAPIRLISAPTCPAGEEQVTEVLELAPREAAWYLEYHDAVHADVVRLADAMGLIPPAR